MIGLSVHYLSFMMARVNGTWSYFSSYYLAYPGGLFPQAIKIKRYFGPQRALFL